MTSKENVVLRESVNEFESKLFNFKFIELKIFLNIMFNEPPCSYWTKKRRIRNYETYIRLNNLSQSLLRIHMENFIWIDSFV